MARNTRRRVFDEAEIVQNPKRFFPNILKAPK